MRRPVLLSLALLAAPTLTAMEMVRVWPDDPNRPKKTTTFSDPVLVVVLLAMLAAAILLALFAARSRRPPPRAPRPRHERARR